MSTSLALKRGPKSMRTAAEISTRKLPVYWRSVSTQQLPSTVRSLSLGLVINGAPSPISIFCRPILLMKLGLLTREIFFVIFPRMNSSISGVLYRARNNLPSTALIHLVCNCSSEECKRWTRVTICLTSNCWLLGGLLPESHIFAWF